MQVRRKFIIDHTELDRYRWTADLHFFHKAMLKYHEARRALGTIEDMNETLIARWNEITPFDGITFVLGDVSFGKDVETNEILDRLNGKKILIAGNHDYHMKPTVQFGFQEVHLYAEADVRLEGGLVQRMTMCHFPLRSWNRMHYGTWNLHGHSHGSMEPIGKQLDVGVDCNNLYPFTFNEIRSRMLNRKIVQVDHHRVK